MLAVTRGAENKIAKGQKCDKCHIVGYEHGTDKGYVYKGKDGIPCAFENLYYIFCKYVKEVDVFECTHYRKYTKKTGKGFKVKITQILPVWRYKY